MTGVLGALAMVSALCACDREPSALIGFGFGRPNPNVFDIVQEELRREPKLNLGVVRIAEPTPEPGGAVGEVYLATRLVSLHGIVGVAGHPDSRGALLASPVYHAARIPLVVPNATSRQLRTVSPWVFTLSPDDSVEGAFIAAFAAGALAARSAAVFYENDEYGRGLRDGVKRALAARGVRIADAPIGTPCQPDQGPLGGSASIALLTPRTDPPDVAVLAARPEDVACVGRLLRARVPGIHLIAGDAVEVDSAIRDERLRAIAPLYVVAFWHSGLTDSASVAFVRTYRHLTGTPPRPAEVLQYDALRVLVQAIREVGANPDAVRRYLSELGVARPAGAGVSGPIAFGAGHRRPLYMMRLNGATVSPVETP